MAFPVEEGLKLCYAFKFQEPGLGFYGLSSRRRIETFDALAQSPTDSLVFMAFPVEEGLKHASVHLPHDLQRRFYGLSSRRRIETGHCAA